MTKNPSWVETVVACFFGPGTNLMEILPTHTCTLFQCLIEHSLPTCRFRVHVRKALLQPV